MLKNLALKKIIVASLALIIIVTIYLFPTNNEYNFDTTITYSNPEVMPIYLIDNNDYVARYNIVKFDSDTLPLVDYVIKTLTINSENFDYLPSGFKAIIPKDTTVLSKSLDEDILKINFSKELLKVPEKDEEKMIEAILYSLLEIKGINKVMIFVEGNNLIALPRSGKRIPSVLDKSYGVNKVYDLKSIKNAMMTTTYYVSKYEDTYYYVPVTTLNNSDKEKVEVIIEKLKVSPTYETNLISFLASRTELINYEILENSVSLSFNNYILNLDTNKISEEVKYSIALSIRDTYNINQTIFYVDETLVDAFNLEVN